LSFELEGNFTAAQAKYEEVFKLQEKVLGKYHPETFRSGYYAASNLTNLGQSKTAVQLFREMLLPAKNNLGEFHPYILFINFALAHALSKEPENQEVVEKSYRQLLKVQVKLLGLYHMDTLSTMNNLAWSISRWPHLQNAEIIYKEVIKLRLKALGAEHVDRLKSMFCLGLVLHDRARHSESEAVFREVWALRLRALGEHHRDTLYTMYWISNSLVNQGKLDEAAQLLWETAKQQSKVLGEEHADTLASFNDLARIFRQLGKHEEAEPILQKTAALLAKSPVTDINVVTVAKIDLADTLHELGRLRDAEDQLRQVVMMMNKNHWSQSSPERSRVMHGLAVVIHELSESDEEAEIMMRDVIEQKELYFGWHSEETVWSRMCLVVILRALHKDDEARRWMEGIDWLNAT
jgi:tetratricopeptide (TPR) repeat protein